MIKKKYFGECEIGFIAGLFDLAREDVCIYYC